MTTKTYSVPNISCGHCVMTIERELKFVDGLQSVKAEQDKPECHRGSRQRGRASAGRGHAGRDRLPGGVVKKGLSDED